MEKQEIKIGEKIPYSAKDKRGYLLPSQKNEITKPIPIKQLVKKYNMPLRDAFLTTILIQGVNSLFKTTKRGPTYAISLSNIKTTPIKDIYHTIYTDIISNGSFPVDLDKKEDVVTIFEMFKNKASFKTSPEDYKYDLFYMKDEEAVNFIKDLNKEFLDKDSNLYYILTEVEKNNLLEKGNEEELLRYIQDIKQSELKSFLNKWFEDIRLFKGNEELHQLKNDAINQFIENDDIEMLNYLLANKKSFILDDYGLGYAKTQKEFLDKIYWRHDYKFIENGQLEKVKNLTNLFSIEKIDKGIFEDVDKPLYTILFDFYPEEEVKLKLSQYALPFKGKYFDSEEEAQEFLNNYIENEFNLDEVLQYRKESLKVDAILQQKIFEFSDKNLYLLSPDGQPSNELYFKDLKNFFDKKEYLDLKNQALTNEEIFGDKKYLKQLEITTIEDKYIVRAKDYNYYISKYYVLGGKAFDTKKEIQEYIQNNPEELETFVRNIQLFNKHMASFGYCGLAFVPDAKKKSFRKTEITPLIGFESKIQKELLELLKVATKDENEEIKTEISRMIFLNEKLDENDIQEIMGKLNTVDSSLKELLEIKLRNYVKEKQEFNKMIEIIEKTKNDYEEIINDLKDYSKLEILHRYYSKLGSILDEIKQEVMPDKNKENKVELEQFLNDDFYNYVKSFRNNKDVSELDIVQEFYLNRVQFGVALTKQEKQERLNTLYDTLSFISDYLNIPKHEVGMYGQITIGLAERGVKGSVATFHYYQDDKHIINITKKGSNSFEKMITNFLHEYTHNTDYILSKIVNPSSNTLSSKKDLFVSENYRAYSKIYELEHLNNKITELESQNPNYEDRIVEIYDFILNYEEITNIKSKLKFSEKLKEITNTKEKNRIILETYNYIKPNVKERIDNYQKLQNTISTLKENFAYQLLKDRCKELDNNRKDEYYSTNRELFARIAETMLHYDLQERFEIDINPNVEVNTIYPIKREFEKIKPLFKEFISNAHSIIEFSAKELKEIEQIQEKKQDILDISKYNYKVTTDNLFGGMIEIFDKETNEVVETISYENITDGVEQANKRIQEIKNEKLNNEIEIKDR